MTTCLSTTLTRIDGIRATASRVGGDISCLASKVGGGITVGVKGTEGLSCAMYQVCRTNVNMHYLEISPQIVWLLAGHTENHVYSNTRWTID